MGEAEEEALFHHRLSMQSNSYMNSCFSIAAARCGKDDGKFVLIGGSAVYDPQGHVLMEAKGTEDEVVVVEIDLEECRPGKLKVRICDVVWSMLLIVGQTFDFGRHRRTETYGIITRQIGAVEPGLLAK